MRDIYNWIGAFYESPLYFYLKRDPINRVDTSEVVGERDVVLIMKEIAFEDYFEFLSFCDTMESTSNPTNNMSEFFAPLDDKRKKEMSKTYEAMRRLATWLHCVNVNNPLQIVSKRVYRHILTQIV